MGPFAVVTLHVECDKDENWNIRYPLSFRSVLEGIPQRLRDMFLEHGVKPTYLISAEVIENEECVSVLAAEQAYGELGTHFHGEFLEPERPLCPKTTSDFGCHYKAKLEQTKLEWLTARFKESFGYQPLSFAAGRWGASGRTARFLSDLGYLVDSSVVSFMVRLHLGLSENTLMDTGLIYFPSVDNLAAVGTLNLMEIPVTAMPSQYVESNAAKLARLTRFFSIRRRERGKLIWLRPTYSSFDDMRSLVETVVQRRGQKTVLNLMFHPFELLPGLSPYATTAAESERIQLRLRKLFVYLTKKNFYFMSMSNVATMLLSRKENIVRREISRYDKSNS
jgi:hypothetical protein